MNFAHNEGLNDRSAVLNYSQAKNYANKIEEAAEFRKHNGRIVSEKFTKYIVDKYYKNKNIKFNFDRVRPDGTRSL